MANFQSFLTAMTDNHRMIISLQIIWVRRTQRTIRWNPYLQGPEGGIQRWPPAVKGPVRVPPGRGAVINSGRIEQIDTIESLFQRPATAFVAEFVEMKNVFPARLENHRARLQNSTLQTDTRGEGPCHGAVRPEHVQLLAQPPAQTSVNCLPGPIHRISDLGIFAALAVQTAGPRFESVIPASEVMARRLREGERIDLAIAPEAIHVIEAAR